MDHLHFEFEAGPQETVEITLDSQASVRLLDQENYENYCAGKSYHFLGGRAAVSPFRLRPPKNGTWHVAVDLDGAPVKVAAGIQLRP